jgi:single-stranded-DNA-specific exonuclease
MELLYRTLFKELSNDGEDERVALLSRELGISRLLAGLLVRRGVASAEDARRFLAPRKEDFYDPFLMKGMEEAVTRIRRAMAARERIMVYGDYDADGATSTAILYAGLKSLGARVRYYIPDRFAEGYGLNDAAIETAAAQGFSLMITVDNGITAHRQADLARRLGIDLIVTDHHQPPEILPDALVILNPKQPDCAYPDKMLSGAGVALKLLHALYGHLPEEFLDLAAVGTIADLVPLRGENRLIAHFGLERINRQPREGLRQLLSVAGLDGKTIGTGLVGFALGPRINASGRLDSAKYAVRLLTAEDPEEAERLARFLDERNRERQGIGEEILQEALAQVEAHPEWLGSKALVIAGEGWNSGVIGIVASRFVETFYRPTLMIAVHGDEAKGSARSIRGFHLYEALHQVSDLFDHFGGHTMAAGFSLKAHRIPELRRRFYALAEQMLSDDDLVPVMEIDAVLSLQEIDAAAVDEIARLAPFGFGNPVPRFAIPMVKPAVVRTVGMEGQHLQLRLAQGRAALHGIYFQNGQDAAALAACKWIDVAGELEVSEWNGRRIPKIVLSAWRKSAVRQAPVLSRERLGEMYRTLRQMQKGSGRVAKPPWESGNAVGSQDEWQVAMQIFEELGLLRTEKGRIILVENPPRASLQDSPTFRKIHERRDGLDGDQLERKSAGYS